MSQRFTDQHVLVTGAAGFIGSHLVEALLAEGARVTGVDNFITGNKANLRSVTSPHFRFIEADVVQPAESYLNNEVFSYIFHFASPASPVSYQEYPRETYLVNSTATDHLLMYLTKTNPKARFIFAGTSEAYGDPLEHPQKETYWGNVNPNGVRSCYDESKRLGETICGVFDRFYDVDTRVVRIFNTYGPRLDTNDGRIISNFVTQALRHEPLTIYGDGSQTRSYCYVSDLVEGVLRLATEPTARGETVNLGNPEEYTALETAQIIWAHIHGTTDVPQFVHQDLPQDDPTRRKPDITKAKQLLDWQPQVNFETGLSQTVAYFKDFPPRE